MTPGPASVRPPRRARTDWSGGIRRLVATAGLAVGLVAVFAGLLPGQPVPAAHAAGSVSVVVKDRPDLVGVADPTYLTEVSVSGSGFQSVPNGFGGIYVFFGWVDGGAWAPSQGGTTGSGYRYVYDDEANPVGYQMFVSFPGSSTEYAANGGEVSADGSWSGTMKIPGSSFESYDRNGDVTTVDCLQVQCGIITIGAHGVVNPSNESFTPITFRDLYSGDAAGAAAAGAAAAASGGAATDAAAAEAAAAEAAAAAASAAEASPAETEADAPAPVSTTIIAAPAAAADDANLVPILLGAIGGVGVLALAAIGFLVWAIASTRRRTRAPSASGVAAAGGAAASAAPAASAPVPAGGAAASGPATSGEGS
ncbi:hypothetical protein [Herbiconiux liangxiaofengii]|uniref:hypothetical protein n=1 Tax=Herbiconiux liangxiaofengii TaxID=3342795 RepID=UPI0035B7F79C